MATGKTEVEIACELIRVLDGLSIDAAQQALARAQVLLLSTQVVDANNPLLAVADQNDATFKRQKF